MVTLLWLKDSNLRRGATLFGSWDRRCTCVTIFVVRGWNRTTGTRRFKSLLYLLSYRTIFEVKNSSVLPHVWYPFIECFITGSCYHSFLKGTTQLEIVLEYPSRSNLKCLIVVLRGLGTVPFGGWWIPFPLWIVDIRWVGKTTIKIIIISKNLLVV